MKKLNDFLNEETNLLGSISMGKVVGGLGRTWKECYEDTYSNNKCDVYTQTTDDEGKFVSSSEKEVKCVPT